MEISNPYGMGLVTHVKPDKTLKLSDLFNEIKFENFEFLLDIGSIYVDGNRVFENIEVTPQSLVRIHRNPKRHPVTNVSWGETIVENNEHFLVVNKPYGIPVHATVDNTRENVISQLSEHLKEKLLITHRLDSETTGLLVFAKTPQFQNIFNYLIQNKMVEKRYRALTANQPPLGKHLHYIKPDRFVPKLATTQVIEGWIPCELIVEDSQQVELPNQKMGYENKILLITGRTHQIRAQLTSLNCPLFADVLYGDDENAKYKLGLRACELKFKWPAMDKEFHFFIP